MAAAGIVSAHAHKMRVAIVKLTEKTFYCFFASFWSTLKAMQKILVIEDDMNIRDLVSYNFKQENFEVSVISHGSDAIRAVRNIKPDLIILDIMLPGKSGLDICREIKAKEETSSIPVIMLTAKSEEVDRIVGFEVGADDYVTKPFSPRELILRARSVLKRTTRNDLPKKTIKFKDMVIDPEKHSVSIGKKEIELTLTEFKLLTFLLQNKEKAIPREKILDHVWGYSSDVFSRTIDTHITRLREKLKDYGKHLHSVRGVGYSWKGK